MSALPVYTPSTRLSDRVSRRLVKHTKIRPFSIRTPRPIVSFSFDDCPRSVIENAFPLLDQHGWKSTLYIAMGLCNTTNHLGLHMSEGDIISAYQDGHEIGNHTYSHSDVRALSLQDYINDIHKNDLSLSACGIPKPSTFAYPYGEVTTASKQALSEHFDLMRGIHAPTNYKTYDLNQAASQRLYSGTDFDDSLAAIQRVAQNKGWLILFTHDVRDNPSDFGCTADEFQHIVQAVSDIGADVLTVEAALKRLGGSS